MEEFLKMAGQIFIILCIQSVLEVMASVRRETQYLKPIALGGYIASLLVVLQFTEKYLWEIVLSINKMF